MTVSQLDTNQTSATSTETQAKFNASRLAISVALCLVALKIASGWYTGSISIFASLLDSTMDVFASTINFLAVRAAARPPDEEHTYGHGKAESLAGLFQSVVVLVSGGFLIFEAARRIITPQATRNELVGVLTMIIALGVSLSLVMYLRRVARETESAALRSEAMHYITDIYTTTSALIALVITLFTGWQLADPIISLVISIYILLYAATNARSFIDALMDRSLPESVNEIVADVITNYIPRGVCGFHDLRTRSAGSEKFIELHLEIEATKTFVEAHAITVDVIRALEEAVPRAHVQIHSDPKEISERE